MSDIWTYTIFRTDDSDKKNQRTEFSCADRVTKKSRRKHDGDEQMTEEELLRLVKYHRTMKEHHEKVGKHYRDRLLRLRQSIAKKTSVDITNNIIEKLKK